MQSPIAPETHPSVSSRILRLVFIACGVVLVIQLIVAIRVGFLSDDFAYLKTVRELHAWTDYVHFIAKPLGTGFEWRPASGVSWIIEAAIFGTTAWLYHIIQIGLIGVCSWLVYLVTKKITAPIVGAVAALLFLLIPFHPESLYWLADITDILGLIGSLGAVLCGLNFIEHGRRRDLLFSSLLLLLGITGKEFAVSTVAILFVYDLIFSGRRQNLLKRRVVTYLTFTILTLALLGLRTHIIGSVTGDTKGHSVLRPLVSLTPYKAVVSRMLILFNLESLGRISPHAVTVWVLIRKFFALGGGVLLFVLTLWQRRNRQFVKTMALAFAIFMLYTIPQTFVLPYISILSLQHNRFLFAPSVGVAIALAAVLVGVGQQIHDWKRWVRWSTLSGVIIIFIIVGAINTRPWLLASNTREQVMRSFTNTYPQLTGTATDMTINVHGLPEDIDGAFLFHDYTSFGEAAWQRYHNSHLTINEVKTDDDVRSACEQPAPNSVCLLWNGQNFEPLHLN